MPKFCAKNRCPWGGAMVTGLDHGWSALSFFLEQRINIRCHISKKYSRFSTIEIEPPHDEFAALNLLLATADNESP
ncbi:uncharacterized protein LMH87_007619 [Akanthomyces muscarius]|uniref:Uncharacterized protein n=1 Tax=Akanthomyces muscarius TaxID=2231603 RepID=A0A9W8UNM7_AKAMU|nr:uncharacterized protein LMH87_007619 [Akanthomyces muscarius]KAJ4161588.1 hypothetical protein LMH87_007619 [Akanthomyces muscarius]